MIKRDIVVIGASAGGVTALKELVKALPEDFQASIFVVLHVSPHSPSILPEILIKSGPLQAVHPNDGERIKSGRIYVAPPDHHLLIEEDRVVVRKGPKENGFRPSVDALFRSAAYVYGTRVIGVVLSGSLDDGTSGLWSIKRLGGLTIVQEPQEALYPSMPVNVLEYVEAHYILPVAEIGAVLTQLTKELAPEKPKVSEEELKRLEMEVLIAAHDDTLEIGIMNTGEVTTFTCPHCHGTLRQLKEGKLVRFRCHTGHAFTMNALLAHITETTEDYIWNAVRSLQETMMLLNHLGEHFQEAGQPEAAEIFFRKAEETAERAHTMQSTTFDQQRYSGDDRHKRLKNMLKRKS
jgi:two-component system, chemotaxis family, protein-glutamate methylesterase/glutaminase